MRKIIVGVMGPGENTTGEDKKNAFELGRLIAEKGWVLLSGGGNTFFKSLNPSLVSVVNTPQEAIKEVNKAVFKTHHLGEPLDNLTRDDIYS